MLITVNEAEKIILENPFPQSNEIIPLKDSLGCILAKDIKADRPFPPFSRVAMDGIAMNSGSYSHGAKLKVESTQLAGESQKELNDPKACIEIMTGAILPKGTDSVIPYEEFETTDGYVHLKGEKFAPGQNVHRMGSDADQGSILVQKGKQLASPELGIAASVGLSEIEVLAPPRIALISTGDELVPIDAIPEPHQVRMSNTASIQSALKSMGIDSKGFHLPDNKEILKNELGSIRENFNVMIVVGGASKGKADFVPEVLESLGIKKLFHGVAQRPGKPFWFGRDNSTLVFGFPGNPVSAFLCFYRYVKPWIASSMNQKINHEQGILAEKYDFKKPLTFFVQGIEKIQGGKKLITPVPGGGSGDLINLSKTDGFLELPQDRNEFEIWESFNWFPFR